jgi:hypothetical protein
MVKRRKNDLQNTRHKTIDRATRTQLKRGGEHRCSGRVSSSAPLVTPVMLNQNRLIEGLTIQWPDGKRTK